MHEWALAESVIHTVEKLALDEGLKKVTKITIMLGELQQIDCDIFKYAMEELKKVNPQLLGDAELDFNVEKATLRCRICGYEWGFDTALDKLDEVERESIHFLPELAHTFVRCPNCGSPDFELKTGRGVTIQTIEGLK